MAVELIDPKRVVIDPAQDIYDAGTFRTRRRRGEVREIALTDHQKSFVCYRKLENQNNETSDTYHPPDGVWEEEFTGMPQSLKQMGMSPRIFVNDRYDGEVELTDEMGIIVRYAGKFAGPRSLNSSGDVISAEEAEENLELQGGGEPSIYNLWNFHIKAIAITNGPELKERALDSAEEQRKSSESKMMDTILSAFERVGSQDPDKLNIKTMPQSKEDMNSFLLEHLSSMDEVERYGLIDRLEEQRDESKAKPSAPEGDDEEAEESAGTLNISLSKGSDHVDNREVKKRGSFPHKTTLPNPKE